MRRLAAVALCLAALSGTGCVCSVWLPDSSGFVFVDKLDLEKGGTKGGRLVLYDLKRKERKVLVADTKSFTLVPALSADGKKIAIARSKVETTKGSRKVKKTFQVVVYGIDGKELKKGKLHEKIHDTEVESTETKEELQPVLLNWSGPADKLLVVGVTPWSEEDEDTLDITLIYDLKTDKVQKVEGVAWLFHNRPVRPDGKGFLTVGKKNEFWHSDWDGKSRKIDNPQNFSLGNAFHESWSKNRFQLRDETEGFAIDVETGKVTATKERLELLKAPGSVRQAWPYAGEKAWLCVFFDDGTDRIELHDLAQKKRKVIVEGKKGEVKLECHHPPFRLSPSPDGKLISVLCVEKPEKGEGKGWIYVIDEKGEVVAKVPWEM